MGRIRDPVPVEQALPIRDVVAAKALRIVLEGLILPRTGRVVRDDVAPMSLDLGQGARFSNVEGSRGNIGLDGSMKGRDPPYPPFDGHRPAGPPPCLPPHPPRAVAIGGAGARE